MGRALVIETGATEKNYPPSLSARRLHVLLDATELLQSHSQHAPVVPKVPFYDIATDGFEGIDVQGIGIAQSKQSEHTFLPNATVILLHTPDRVQYIFANTLSDISMWTIDVPNNCWYRVTARDQVWHLPIVEKILAEAKTTTSGK